MTFVNSDYKIFWSFRFLLIGMIVCILSCKTEEKQAKLATSNFNLNKEIEHCEMQLTASSAKLTDLTKHPRLIEKDQREWKEIPNGKLVWTSGFYPGILWYMYEVTGDEKWKKEAIKRTEVFEDFKNVTQHHDIGFMMFPAFGHGYSIGNKLAYKDILLTSAQSLATRYNENVGAIKSWSNLMHPRWQQHIVIIDNMMNLELLFWSAKNGGDSAHYDIAVKHAETTLENHFREDYTSWHVLEYDTISGQVLNRHTKQGFSDDSRWSRGQAWGVYGYTMVYKETKDKKFLDFAQKIADKYLDLLPADFVPCWDFDVAHIPNEEKDASAAAIVASALLDLSTLVEAPANQKKYYTAALNILESLSSDKYSGIGKTNSFLVHATGAKSLGKEIDVALIYADYYYIEALARLKKLQLQN